MSVGAWQRIAALSDCSERRARIQLKKSRSSERKHLIQTKPNTVTQKMKFRRFLRQKFCTVTLSALVGVFLASTTMSSHAQALARAGQGGRPSLPAGRAVDPV